jgi:hypothetical protein
VTRALKEVPRRYKVLFVAYWLSFFAFLLGPPLILLARRPGVYVLLFGFTAYVSTHRILAFAVPQAKEDDPFPRLTATANPGLTWAYAVAWAGLGSGLFVAALGYVVGAYLLVCGLLIQLSFNVLVGVTSYGDVMNRPWPQVTPLDEDDDW